MKGIFPSGGSAPGALYEVTDVVLPEERLAQLHGAELDAPQPASRGDTHSVRIAGWAIGRDNPVRAVEVTHGGRVLRLLRSLGPRPEVAGRFEGVPEDAGCSFDATVGLVGLGRECELTVRARLPRGERALIGAVRLRRVPVESGFEPAIQPLMMTALGRSGSSWMMQILASLPRVSVYSQFPYESKIAQYWLHVLRVLSKPANPDDSTNVAFEYNDWWAGANPYNDQLQVAEPRLREWLGRAYVDRLAAFCQSNIESWYAAVAEERGTASEPPAVYFAEKFVPSALQGVAWEIYPNAKEIVLVRDFRDMARSVLAFDEKRGFFGFGRRSDESEESYIATMRTAALGLAAAWRDRGDRSHLVRYEDLVFRPEETMSELLAYLELGKAAAAGADPAAAAAADEAAVRMHRTSPDAAASVGRWRTDLGEPLKAVCQEAFGDVLEQFGYSEDGYVPGKLETSPTGE